jgi:hypothetical protein
MISWFVTLMTFSFSQKAWKNMNDMCELFLDNVRGIKIYTKLEKCEFHKINIESFGYIIFGDGSHINLHKVQAIVEWAIPTSICDVQCFFGFANFY